MQKMRREKRRNFISAGCAVQLDQAANTANHTVACSIYTAPVVPIPLTCQGVPMPESRHPRLVSALGEATRTTDSTQEVLWETDLNDENNND